MDFGVDVLFGEVAAQDVGVGGGDTLAAEEPEPFVSRRFGHGQREAAAAEPEVHDLLDGESLFGNFVQSHDAQVGDAHGYGLRDIVVAQVEDFERKPFRAGDEFAFALGNADACFGKQFDALFVQSAFGLDGNSQHIRCVFDCFSVFWTPTCGTAHEKAHPQGVSFMYKYSFTYT